MLISLRVDKKKTSLSLATGVEMEFHQLEYFLAAAHTQNFRQAAELCLITQPALSRQIAALEKELGMLLFQRSKQHVVLTPAGQLFLSILGMPLTHYNREYWKCAPGTKT